MDDLGVEIKELGELFNRLLGLKKNSEKFVILQSIVKTADSINTRAGKLATEKLAKALLEIMPEDKILTEDKILPTGNKKTKLDSLIDLAKNEKVLASVRKKTTIEIMKFLRKEGGTFKEVAIFLNEKEIKTFSRRGKWHAQIIHRLTSK